MRCRRRLAVISHGLRFGTGRQQLAAARCGAQAAVKLKEPTLCFKHLEKHRGGLACSTAGAGLIFIPWNSRSARCSICRPKSVANTAMRDILMLQAVRRGLAKASRTVEVRPPDPVLARCADDKGEDNIGWAAYADPPEKPRRRVGLTLFPTLPTSKPRSGKLIERAVRPKATARRATSRNMSHELRTP